MAAALYDPQEGYYARPAGQVGRGGDFFTSVSAGPLFGRLLAECVVEWYYEAVMPPRWRLIEVGANDGSLASDLHAALRGMDVELCGMEHVVIEPLPQLATALREKCGDFLRVVDSAEVLADDPVPSFALGNEVLDALPFHLIESDGRAWQELGVTLEGGAFAWTGIGPVAPELVKGIPVFPAGYRTEVRGNFRDFLAPLVAAMDGGRMLWIDYGFPRDDYYHESRTTGTLRTFSRHRAAEDPLQSPGEIDITAHVDFTAVEEAVHELGGKVLLLERQGRFLTSYARPWLMSMEGRTDAEAMKAVRAFQTLTHPGQLGASFHMMMAEWAG